MKTRVLVVGSSNTDMIVRVDRLPAAGETVLGGRFLTAAGGKGANQAVGAARAGGAVTFLGRVGNDAFGIRALAALEEAGVNTRLVRRDLRAPSGVALIFVARDGANSIAVAPGANGRFSPADLQHARSVFADIDTLLLQLETPLRTVEAAIRRGVQAGTRIILNPAPARPLPNRLLRQISILTPNESEAEQLTGIRVASLAGARAAGRRLLARGVETVVVTLGAQGALVVAKECEELVPAFRVTPVDTTAAGDIFNGALAVGLGEGKPLLEAVRFANAAAALSVTKSGAQPSAPGRRAIDRLLRGSGTRSREVHGGQ